MRPSIVFLTTPVLLFLLVIIACSKAVGPYFTSTESVPDDQAAIYIYRPPETWQERGLISFSHDGYFDGVRVASVDHGEYLVYNANPGRFILSVGRETLEIEVKRGNIYFIRLGIDGFSQQGQMGRMVVSYHLRKVVSPSDAEKDLKQCRRIELGTK